MLSNNGVVSLVQYIRMKLFQVISEIINIFTAPTQKQPASNEIRVVLPHVDIAVPEHHV
jgi:hypothetical protein